MGIWDGEEKLRLEEWARSKPYKPTPCFRSLQLSWERGWISRRKKKDSSAIVKFPERNNSNNAISLADSFIKADSWMGCDHFPQVYHQMALMTLNWPPTWIFFGTWFIFKCFLCVPACMCVLVPSEASVRSCGTGVTGAFELPCKCWESNPCLQPHLTSNFDLIQYICCCQIDSQQYRTN